ncbi:MAG: hypothetical protein M3126_11305 [Candidatus Eremiobacteraeota bacterium]|nr:hypothetical protein [Candidatus Eremiobacteraeota bacterium]
MYERAIELERAHRYGDALQAFAACAATNEILGLLSRKGTVLLEQGGIDAVASSINTILTKQETLPSPLACLMGTIEARRGRTDVSEAWFRDAAAAASTKTEAADIAYRHACALAGRFQGEACEELLLPLIQDEEIPGDLRACAMALLAVAYVLGKRFEEAVALVNRALKTIDDHAAPIVRAQVFQHSAWVQLFSGDVRAAKALAPGAARLAMENGLYEIAAHTYSVLYNMAFDIDDDPHASAKYLQTIEECASRTKNSESMLYALLGQYDLAAQDGDFAEVARLRSDLQGHEVAYSHITASQTLVPAEALELAANGEFQAAYELLAPSAPRQSVMDDRLALRFAEIAIYAAAAGMNAESAEAEAAALAALERMGQKSLRTQRAQIYLALVAMVNGKEDNADAILQDLKSQIPPQARIRTFLDSVILLWNYRKGAENHDELFRSMDLLRSRKLGGIALLIESLPHPTLAVD